MNNDTEERSGHEAYIDNIDIHHVFDTCSIGQLFGFALNHDFTIDQDYTKYTEFSEDRHYFQYDTCIASEKLIDEVMQIAKTKLYERVLEAGLSDWTEKHNVINPDSLLAEDISLEKSREMVSDHPAFYYFLEQEHREDIINQKAILAYDPQILKYCTKQSCDDRLLMFNAVSMDGNLLKQAAPELQDNKKLVLKAVNQNPSALIHASDDLRNDNEVVLEAIKRSPRSIKHASQQIQDLAGTDDPVHILEKAISAQRMMDKLNTQLKPKAIEREQIRKMKL